MNILKNTSDTDNFLFIKIKNAIKSKRYEVFNTYYNDYLYNKSLTRIYFSCNTYSIVCCIMFVKNKSTTNSKTITIKLK